MASGSGRGSAELQDEDPASLQSSPEPPPQPLMAQQTHLIGPQAHGQSMLPTSVTPEVMTDAVVHLCVLVFIFWLTN